MPNVMIYLSTELDSKYKDLAKQQNCSKVDSIIKILEEKFKDDTTH